MTSFALLAALIVNPVQFMSTWYQIAQNPVDFQPADCACGRQVLAIRHDGKVNVTESCNGFEIHGVATPSDETNSKFNLVFNTGVQTDYWVVALDSQYRYAVVTDRDQHSLFILSKTPAMGSLYHRALKDASQHVDTSHLKLDSQKGCTYPATLD